MADNIFSRAIDYWLGEGDGSPGQPAGSTGGGTRGNQNAPEGGGVNPSFMNDPDPATTAEGTNPLGFLGIEDEKTAQEAYEEYAEFRTVLRSGETFPTTGTFLQFSTSGFQPDVVLWKNGRPVTVPFENVKRMEADGWTRSANAGREGDISYQNQQLADSDWQNALQVYMRSRPDEFGQGATVTNVTNIARVPGDQFGSDPYSRKVSFTYRTPQGWLSTRTINLSAAKNPQAPFGVVVTALGQLPAATGAGVVQPVQSVLTAQEQGYGLIATPSGYQTQLWLNKSPDEQKASVNAFIDGAFADKLAKGEAITPDDRSDFVREWVKQGYPPQKAIEALNTMDFGARVTNASILVEGDQTYFIPGGELITDDLPGEGGEEVIDPWQQMLLDLIAGLGSGPKGPVYNAPDRRTAEDWTRQVMSGLTGAQDEQEIQRLTDLYMAEHKRDFRQKVRGQGEVDYQMAVIEQIRGREDYQRIHKFRPGSVSEEQWYTQATAGALAGGLAGDEAAKAAANLATVGEVDDVAQTVQLQQFAKQGRGGAASKPRFFRNIAQATNAITRARI